jgi:hypothetical protein
MQKSIHALKLSALIPAMLMVGSAAAVTVSIGTQLNADPIVNRGSADGFHSFTGSAGGYNQIMSSGTAAPIYSYPNFSTTSLDVSTNGTTDVLSVFVSEAGLTDSGRSYGLSMLNSLGVTRVSSGWTLETNVWLDPTNTVFGRGSLLATRTFTGPLGASSVNLPSFVDVKDPYSITVEYKIQSNGNKGSVNATADMTDVPAPASTFLLGLGLTALGLFRFQTNEKQASKTPKADANKNTGHARTQSPFSFAAHPIKPLDV